MHRTLVEFIKVLRNADIQVSPAETLDALRVLDVIGARDRSLLKHSLSITVSKTLEEKEAFNECFDRYFSYSNYAEEKKQIVSLDDSEQFSGNDVQPKQKSKARAKEKQKQKLTPKAKHESRSQHMGQQRKQKQSKHQSKSKQQEKEHEN